MIAVKTWAKNRTALVFVIIITILTVMGTVISYTRQWRQDSLSQSEKDVAVFKYQVKKEPYNLEAHLNLAWAYYKQGKKEEALGEYRKALAIDKADVRAIYGIGLVAKEMGNYGEAELRMKEILRREPNHQPAAYTLAQVYRDTRKLDKAVEHYRIALRISPAEANIRAELGKVFEDLGRREDARREYREALRYVPNLKEASDGIRRLMVNQEK